MKGIGYLVRVQLRSNTGWIQGYACVLRLPDCKGEANEPELAMEGAEWLLTIAIVSSQAPYTLKPEYSRLLAQEFVPPEMAESSCQWRGGSAQLPLSGSARPAQVNEEGALYVPHRRPRSGRKGIARWRGRVMATADSVFWRPWQK